MASAAEVSLHKRSEGLAPLQPVELDLALPPDVAAFALAIDDLSAVLAALEGSDAASSLPGTFALKRRAEYLAGRYAAASALGALGLPGRVERSSRGLPLWPPGSVGSISHGGGLACAVCGREERWRSIGVDVERVLHDTEARELAPAIAHQDELFLLRAALPQVRSGQRLSVLFSAKESLFKCLFPLSGTFLEFSDARLVSVGTTSGQRGLLSLRLERGCGSALPSGRTLQAHFSVSARRIESAVLLGAGD